MPHDHARDERTALCALLTELGPDQPTLCEGWTTRDLAAHLVVRERRPLAAPGLVVRRFAGYTARERSRAAARPFQELVELLRAPPRWSPAALDPLDRAINGLEMFLHHEDVRRARPGWQPRRLAPGLTRLLWSRVRALARLRLRRFPATVVVAAPGHGELRTGAAGPEVRVSADPGELAIFLTGRQRAARVDLTGPDELTERLTTARLSL